tara:strand:- start:25237 stop:26610 length:1374 start_codon:yes stop_codon:yes gene_type:complete
MKTALIGATLLDGNGGQPIENSIVIFEDDTIVEVGSEVDITVPLESKRVDVSGKCIIPGIVNGNVHLLDGWTFMMVSGAVEYLARYEGRLHEVIEEAAQIALKNGVTTVFDTYNALQPVTYARDRIASGSAIGARIFAAGNIVGMGGPFSADFAKKARETSTQTFCNRMDELFEAGVGRRLAALPPEEVRLIIREYLTKGIDMLKFAVSDHILEEFMNPHLTFSTRVQKVIAEETKAAGKPLLTHTTSLESLNDAVNLGADLLIHATMTAQVPIPDELISKIKEKNIYAGIQAVDDNYQNHLECSGSMMAGYAGGVHRDNAVRMIDQGVKVVLGTDAGCTDPDCLGDMPERDRLDRPWSLGEDHFHWFRAMHDLGMEPMDILQAATINVARAYKKDQLIGSIEIGKLADIVVLDNNPLQDVGNYRKIHSIYQSGRLVNADGLPTKRIVTDYPRAEPS